MNPIRYHSVSFGYTNERNIFKFIKNLQVFVQENLTESDTDPDQVRIKALEFFQNQLIRILIWMHFDVAFSILRFDLHDLISHLYVIVVQPHSFLFWVTFYYKYTDLW